MDEYRPDNHLKDNYSNRENTILRDIINANLKEQKLQRRWKIFFRFAFLIAFIALPILIMQASQKAPLNLSKSVEHTALVRLEGIIASGAPASAENVNDTLQQAFENKNSKGVILYINSPGGSPVQSAQVNRRISELREQYPAKPIYAVINDICASGAYYAAVATDTIYANESSLVGSIGVIYGSFGFTQLIKKVGIERRVITAGENKNMLDPFSPEKEADKRHIQRLIDQMHKHFIKAVTEGRKGKLKSDQNMFSGLIWSGEEAVQLGLVDALGDSQQVAEKVIGAETIVEYKTSRSLIDRLAGQVGTYVKHAILEQILLHSFY